MITYGITSDTLISKREFTAIRAGFESVIENYFKNTSQILPECSKAPIKVRRGKLWINCTNRYKVLDCEKILPYDDLYLTADFNIFATGHQFSDCDWGYSQKVLVRPITEKIFTSSIYVSMGSLRPCADYMDYLTAVIQHETLHSHILFTQGHTSPDSAHCQNENCLMYWDLQNPTPSLCPDCIGRLENFKLPHTETLVKYLRPGTNPNISDEHLLMFAKYYEHLLGIGH